MGFDSKSESIQGRFYRINKKIEKRICARYDKIKDWVMDPKGYFLISVDKEKKLRPNIIKLKIGLWIPGVIF